jgi:hypothetical protein
MHCIGKMEPFQRGDAARRQWPQVARERQAIARKLQWQEVWKTASYKGIAAL